MRKTILRIASEQRRHRQSAEGGFSLIELIVVVAILGVLVAIAIPVFGNIQATARQNAVAAVAANGATQATAQIANGDPATLIQSGDPAVTVAWQSGSAPTTIDAVCVVATHSAGETASSGPGCS
jgi:prepilin-type N-terminal cleavage/methylation domain-containing protein